MQQLDHLTKDNDNLANKYRSILNESKKWN